MWLFTKQGFYSAVEHRDDPERIIVRARAKKDLEALQVQIPNMIIFHGGAKADYPHRAIVSREEWTIAVARLAMELDYTNFKNSIADNRRHSTYLGVWTKLLEIESEDGGKSHWQRTWQTTTGKGKNGGSYHDADEHLFHRLPGESEEEFQEWLHGSGWGSHTGVSAKPKKKRKGKGKK